MAVFPSEYCASQRSPGRLFRRINKLMTAFVESRFEGHGLSFVQWIALKVVRDGVVHNAGELARELGITTGATTRLIDGLEERGLLSRDRSGEDRRVVRIVVTPAGDDAVAPLQAQVVEAWNEAFAGFEQAEADEMIAALRKLLAAAERLVGTDDWGRETLA